MLAEAEQVPAFAKSLHAQFHANPKIVQGRRFSTLLDFLYTNSAVVDLSLFWLLLFDDILANTETVAGGEHGFCLFLPDPEDFSASNFASYCPTALSADCISATTRLVILRKSAMRSMRQASPSSTHQNSTPAVPLESILVSRQSRKKSWNSITVAGLGSHHCRPWHARSRFLLCSSYSFNVPPLNLNEHLNGTIRFRHGLRYSSLKSKALGETLLLLSLLMSYYLFSAAQTIGRLPTLLSHLARPSPHDPGQRQCSVPLELLRSLPLKVNQ